MSSFKSQIAKRCPAIWEKLRQCKLCIMEFYMYLYGKRRGITRNKIIFQSFNGKKYADSPKVISEMLHLLMPEADIVWCFRKDKVLTDIPGYIRAIPNQGLQYIKELATASIWIDNFEKHRPIYKSENQYYIQTWHGDRGFKKVCYEAYPSEYVMLEEKIADLCIAASEYGVQTYRRAFRYCGEILNIGMPRNDDLINGNQAKTAKIRRLFGLDYNTKILLYAPTFRDAHRANQSPLIDINRCLNILGRTGYKWTCMVRAHSAVVGGLRLSNEEQNEKILDVTSYEDMADLLLLADILISDYSSCANDFVLTRKPAIIAAFDLDYYKQSCRDLNVDINETGFVYATSQRELEDILANIDKYDWDTISDRVDRYYGTSETGTSTRVITERIISMMK